MSNRINEQNSKSIKRALSGFKQRFNWNDLGSHGLHHKDKTGLQLSILMKLPCTLSDLGHTSSILSSTDWRHLSRVSNYMSVVLEMLPGIET